MSFQAVSCLRLIVFCHVGFAALISGIESNIVWIYVRFREIELIYVDLCAILTCVFVPQSIK